MSLIIEIHKSEPDLDEGDIPALLEVARMASRLRGHCRSNAEHLGGDIRGLVWAQVAKDLDQVLWSLEREP